MADEIGARIGRVCPYALQQCTIEQGCVTHDGPIFGEDVLKLNFAALQCRCAGSSLFASELRTGELREGHEITVKRGALRAQRLNQIDKLLRARKAADGDKATTAALTAAADNEEGR